jgi:hypothetical protein
VERPNEPLGLGGGVSTAQHSEDSLGTVDLQELLKIIKTPDYRPLSIERLGNNPPPQLNVKAHFTCFSYESAGAKTLYKILSHIHMEA